MSSESLPRYAVYFTPRSCSQLATFGRLVLQADALPADHPIRISATRKAAHYGFHATLKAPMELAAGCGEKQLLDSVEAFAKQQKRVLLSGLAPRLLDGFLALTVSEAKAINTLAERVINTFDQYRAPLSDMDRNRRMQANLSSLQCEYLEQFGYPYVLKAFRFHMTLSGRISSEQDLHSYLAWLDDLYAQTVTQPPWLDQLTVAFQPNRQTAFTPLATFPVQ